MRDTVEIEQIGGITYVNINGVRVDRVYSVRREGKDIEVRIHAPKVVFEGEEMELEDAPHTLMQEIGVHPVH